MRDLLLIIFVMLFYCCDLPNAKTKELQQLEERITLLEHRIDSLTKVTNADSLQRVGTTLPSNNCAAVTKKGSPCRRKAGSSGYCWQHKK